MSNSLPGYDDWLDNHGNPGIEPEPEPLDELDSSGVTEQYRNKEDEMYPRWAIEEQIDVTMTSSNPDIYLIQRVNGDEQFNLNFGPKSADPDKVDERTLLLDGEYVDLGDDFISFISILDDYREQGGGEQGRTMRMNPWKVQEELDEDKIEDADH
jgi:hypothetical protein